MRAPPPAPHVVAIGERRARRSIMLWVPTTRGDPNPPEEVAA